MHIVPTFLSIIFIVFTGQAFGQTRFPPNVEQAVAFLKAACVTGGSSLDIKVTGDGGLLLRNIIASGVKGSVSITKKELEGLADAASAVAGQQASEMRACMKPHIDRILSALLSQGSAVKPEAITINADGGFFITAEFDRVLKVAADDPTNFLTVDELSTKSGVSKGKVLLYIAVAKENNLASSGFSGESLKIKEKGIKYALAKGLIQ